MTFSSPGDGGLMFDRVGQVKVEGEYATLIFERRFPHPVDAVWQAITDSSELSKWYFSRGTIEARSGGKVDFYLGPAHVTGSVLVWDPPRVFEHDWIASRPGSPNEEFGIVRWELEGDENETILKLTHRKLPVSTAHDFAIGVHVRLDRLEAFLDGKPQPFWKTHLEDVQAKYLDP
jgi:uncharacterized protein YndB with AHSA1/START domain